MVSLVVLTLDEAAWASGASFGVLSAAVLDGGATCVD